MYPKANSFEVCLMGTKNKKGYFIKYIWNDQVLIQRMLASPPRLSEPCRSTSHPSDVYVHHAATWLSHSLSCTDKK